MCDIELLVIELYELLFFLRKNLRIFKLVNTDLSQLNFRFFILLLLINIKYE